MRRNIKSTDLGNKFVNPIPTAVLIAIVFITVGCDLHEFTPDPQEMASESFHGSVFNVEGSSDFRGHYGNSDVNSVIYSYTIDSDLEPTFWSELEARASTDDWKKLNGATGHFYSRELYGEYKTLYEYYVRVAVCRNNNSVRILIGWLQVGSSSEAEYHFGESTLWPKFEALRQELSGPPQK